MLYVYYVFSLPYLLNKDKKAEIKLLLKVKEYFYNNKQYFNTKQMH